MQLDHGNYNYGTFISPCDKSLVNNITQWPQNIDLFPTFCYDIYFNLLIDTLPKTPLWGIHVFEYDTVTVKTHT